MSDDKASRDFLMLILGGNNGETDWRTNINVAYALEDIAEKLEGMHPTHAIVYVTTRQLKCIARKIKENAK